MYCFSAKLVVISTLLLLLMGNFSISGQHLDGDRLVHRSEDYTKLFCRSECCFGRRRLLFTKKFPILRSAPSPPPPPVEGRKRAMNVPPAPASTFFFH